MPNFNLNTVLVYSYSLFEVYRAVLATKSDKTEGENYFSAKSNFYIGEDMSALFIKSTKILFREKTRIFCFVLTPFILKWFFNKEFTNAIYFAMKQKIQSNPFSKNRKSV